MPKQAGVPQFHSMLNVLTFLNSKFLIINYYAEKCRVYQVAEYVTEHK